MTAGLSQAVNVNQLPTHGIDHIEVLRDGASSIYGSDAVGGVINYVLKRDIEGVEASLRYDLPQDGAGESCAGRPRFRHRLRGGARPGVRHGRRPGSQAMRLTDRDFSRSSLNVDRAPTGIQCAGRSVRRALHARLLAHVPTGSTGTRRDVSAAQCGTATLSTHESRRRRRTVPRIRTSCSTSTSSDSPRRRCGAAMRSCRWSST